MGNHARGILLVGQSAAALATVWRGFKWLVSAGGDVDFVVTRWDNLNDAITDVVQALTAPTEAQSNALFLGGLAAWGAAATLHYYLTHRPGPTLSYEDEQRIKRLADLLPHYQELERRAQAQSESGEIDWLDVGPNGEEVPEVDLQAEWIDSEVRSTLRGWLTEEQIDDLRRPSGNLRRRDSPEAWTPAEIVEETVNLARVMQGRLTELIAEIEKAS